jgi:hypothetical protein
MLPNRTNYYADAEPSNVNPGPADKTTEAPKEDEQGETAEIPKAVLGGRDLKPGEEVTLKVVKVLDGSVLVSASGGDDEREEEPPPEQEAAPAPTEPPAPAGDPNYQ